jgi:chromosome transmission fidelity protein 1
MAHLEERHKTAKQEYLESLCARTLNQTIGRGVRHLKDYVNVYLIDARFERIKHKLSEWMKDRVVIVNDIEGL